MPIHPFSRAHPQQHFIRSYSYGYQRRSFSILIEVTVKARGIDYGARPSFTCEESFIIMRDLLQCFQVSAASM
jgi:hypothetical protein